MVPRLTDRHARLCAAAVLTAFATAGPPATLTVAAAEAAEAAAESPPWLKRDKVPVGNARDLPDGFLVYSLGRPETSGKRSFIVL